MKLLQSRWFVYLLVLAYVLFPFDLILDFIKPIGYLDDLIIALIVWSRMKKKRANTKGSFSADSKDDIEVEPIRTDSDSPYVVLELNPDATEDEVDSAYRKLAAQYHPDKVSHLGEDLQKLAHEKMVAIQTAYDKIKKSFLH